MSYHYNIAPQVNVLYYNKPGPKALNSDIPDIPKIPRSGPHLPKAKIIQRASDASNSRGHSRNKAFSQEQGEDFQTLITELDTVINTGKSKGKKKTKKKKNLAKFLVS
jgi:hypothetical protein